MKSSRPSESAAGRMLLALGIVFGDIGTSPLYAYETALSASGGGAQAAIGIASLIIWTLLLVVGVKYGGLVMRADYMGEGGILAMMARLKHASITSRAGGRWLILLLAFGAALLFGDGAITPAISVLSAVEGLESVHPDLGHLVLPLAILILVALFLVQRFGTGRLGWVFGPIMALWFGAIGLVGAIQVASHPDVLWALNPLEGLRVLHGSPARAGMIVGGVVLAVTGAEALYADMGHFGRPAILNAWRAIVFPALILNYLGQAARVISVPESAADPNLFFTLFPTGGFREGMVVLATLATVIASQALISGIFSLSSQAIDLGYLPRFFVKHTSARTRGQIYIPLVNYLLGGVCILIVISFRSSSALAGAYGMAVTGAMIVTSIAFVAIVVAVWNKPVWLGGLLLFFLLALDLPLFVACLGKILDGGFVPLAFAAAVTAVMVTWRRGRDLIHEAMAFGAVSVAELGAKLDAGEFRRTPCTQVFLVRKPIPDQAVTTMLEQVRRVKVLGENLIILLLNPAWDDPWNPVQSIHVEFVGQSLCVISAKHGFMTEPDVPELIRRAREQSEGVLNFCDDEVFYVMAHEIIVDDAQRRLPAWQRHLLAFLSRNILPGPDYLRIPPAQLLIYNWMLRL